VWLTDHTIALSAAAARAILLPSRPNPFNSSTTVTFELSEPSRVELSIYDVSGRLVREWRSLQWTARNQSVTWAGDMIDGSLAPQGIYFARFHLDGQLIGAAKIVRVE